MPDPRDLEIRAYLLTAPADTYTGLADAVRERFGPGRAWPAELIAAVRLELSPPRPGRGGRYDGDQVLMAFIADRADLTTLDNLLEAGIDAFGVERFPSRSQLHRLILALRKERRKSLRKARGA